MQATASSRQAVTLEPRRLSAEAGHISGIVVNSSEEPIEGALCRILRGSAPVVRGLLSRGARLREEIVSGRSDEHGSFRLKVPAGFWVLRVEAEGKSPWEEGFLQPGDFRWVLLGPARSLTVHVRDDLGDVVAGAEVRLIEGEFDDPEEAIVRERTNGNGAASLTSVPSGTWYVHVTHPDYVGAVEKLPPGQSGHLAIEVRLTRGIRIVGKVSLDGGRAPPRPPRVLFDTLDGFISSHEVESDPDGRYSSRVAFPGNETLEVAALVPGYGESRKEVSLGEPPPSGEHEVNFVLDTLERTVIGRVVDADGRVIEGVEVYAKPLLSLPPEGAVKISAKEIVMGMLPDFTAFDPKPSMAARLRRVSSTDADGRFRVGGLHAQKPYNLLLVSELHSNATLWVEKGEPGGTTDLGTVRLGPGGRVWGYVRRPDGTPIEGAQVHTVTWTHIDVTGLTEFPTKRAEVLRSPQDSITNDEGYFSIQPYPEGEFHLSCLGTTFGPYSLPPGGPIEIVTENIHRRDPARSIPVVLMVVDDAGAPVPKAYAQLRGVRPESEGPAPFSIEDWASWTWDVGDDSGRVELDTSEGTYSIEVRDIEGQLADQSFVVEVTKGGVHRDVVLHLAPDPSLPLEGVVQTKQGEPLPDFKVELIPDTGEVSCNCLHLDVRTGLSGAFSFGPFMKGNHRLVVTDPQGRSPATYYYPARPGDPIVVTME